MVIKMIMRQIGKYPPGEFQPAGTFLLQCVRGYLHEGMGTSGVHHTNQVAVDRDCIGSGMEG